MNKSIVYVGTYGAPITTGSGEIFCGKGQGLYCMEFDSQTGILLHTDRFIDTQNVSFLWKSTDNTLLYAVNELDRFNNQDGGAVSAFSVGESGLPVLINQVTAVGTAPCHLCVDMDQKRLFVANYLSGSISIFSLLPNGGIGELLQQIKHAGKSVNPARQESAHVHWVMMDNADPVLYSVDLGMDKIISYGIKSLRSPIHYTMLSAYKAKQGNGPRSLAQSVNGKFLYVTNELAGTVSVLKKEEGNQLVEIQSMSSLPHDFSGSNLTSELHFSLDGKFLYVGNRGHDSICVYHVDDDSGKLSHVQWCSSYGHTPRSFNLDVSEKWLLVANQDSDNIVIYERNTQTGELKQFCEYSLPTPVCVRAYAILGDFKTHKETASTM